MTQMEYAEKGILSPQIQHVAEVERRTPQLIAEKVAAGTVVIPANIRHRNLVPCGIGRELKTKINANLGNSALSSCPGAEKSKLAIALHYGADTVMDLSTGGEITTIRRTMLEQSTVPLGTVPVYEVVARYGNKDFAREKILDVIRRGLYDDPRRIAAEICAACPETETGYRQPRRSFAGGVDAGKSERKSLL